MLKQNQTKLKKHAQNPQMNKKKSKQKTKTKTKQNPLVFIHSMR